MRRYAFWNAVVTVALTAAVSPGATKAENKEIWAALTPAIPAGGFGDLYNVGVLGLHVGAGYRVRPQLTVGGAVEFNRFSLDADGLKSLGGIPADTDVTGGGSTMLGFVGIARYVFTPEGTQPYVTAELGVTKLSVSDIEYSVSGSGYTSAGAVPVAGETKPKIAFGAGVDVPVGAKMKCFAEGGYHIILTSDESTSCLMFRIGVRYGL
ncbi:MAG: hypothetical protein JXO72_14560 [Vicinamibacteria bacterium]|nr:hypothetical protein [Vicinamibacteria bacterium]